MCFRFLLIFLFLSMTSSAWGAVVRKLSVQGNQFIETAIIKKHLQLKEGEPYSPNKAEKDVKNLYKLGFFKGIEVLKKTGNNYSIDILYRIQEKPLAGKIEFEGK